MKLIAVLMGEPKVDGLIEEGMKQDPIAANPPLTVEGMRDTQAILEKLLQEEACKYPFTVKRCYSSRTARTLCTASVLAMAFGIDIESLNDLTVYKNGEGKKGNTPFRSVYYPQHDGLSDNPTIWERRTMKAIAEIKRRHSDDTTTIVVVIHDPQMAILISRLRDINIESAKPIAREIINGDRFAIFDI